MGRYQIIKGISKPMLRVLLKMKGGPVPKQRIMVGRGDILLIKCSEDCNIQAPPGEMVYIAGEQIGDMGSLLTFMFFAEHNKK